MNRKTVPSPARLSVAAVAIASAFAGAAGTASADPDLSPVINTTCSYSQVVSALSAEDATAAAEFSASAASRMALRGFLASPPDDRQQVLQQATAGPGAQRYVQQYAGYVLQIVNVCHNY